MASPKEEEEEEKGPGGKVRQPMQVNRKRVGAKAGNEEEKGGKGDGEE